MSDERVKVWIQQFQKPPTLKLQWIDPDTSRRKTKSTGTNDAEKAERARADLEYELNHGMRTEASNISWERFRDAFEDEYVEGTRPNTQQNYHYSLNAFERIAAPTKLKSITARTISQFVAGMRKEPGRSKGAKTMESTIAVRLEFLHKALTWATDQKMLAELPDFPVVKPPKKNPQPIPSESFERLYAKAKDDQTRVYLLCGWLAGLRMCEAAALEWHETDQAPYVDFARSRIIFPAEFVKAGKDQWVPIDPELRRMLERLPRHGAKVFRFTDTRGRMLAETGISQRVRALAKKAGVRLTMHSLRKGFGCYHASRVAAQTLQKLMRHSNIKTTMDYYANVDDAVEAAVLVGRNAERNAGSFASNSSQTQNVVSHSRTVS
jgi:integrase